ncbi:hypothetical protein KAH94_03590 [bacterium]|nr:hypothetical protein [bacterium]
MNYIKSPLFFAILLVTLSCTKSFSMFKNFFNSGGSKNETLKRELFGDDFFDKNDKKETLSDGTIKKFNELQKTNYNSCIKNFAKLMNNTQNPLNKPPKNQTKKLKTTFEILAEKIKEQDTKQEKLNLELAELAKKQQKVSF